MVGPLSSVPAFLDTSQLLNQSWIPSDRPRPPGLRLARVERSVLSPVPHYCRVIYSIAGLRKDVLGDPQALPDI